MSRKLYLVVGVLVSLIIAAVVASCRSSRTVAVDRGSNDRKSENLVQPEGSTPSTMSTAEFQSDIEAALKRSTQFAPAYPDQFCSAASELMKMAVASSPSTSGEWLSWFHKRDMMLDRKMAAARFGEYYQWKMIPGEITETASDEEIARVLWDSTRTRKMIFAELDRSSVQVGSRLDAVLDSPTWPYPWIHSSASLFTTRSGGLKADELRPLIEANRTGFVQQRVRFIDGRWGHVRIAI